MQMKKGDKVPPLNLSTVMGKRVDVPDQSLLVHVQFRRWVGCPICNTHMAELRRRAADIKTAGIKEVIFFHSTARDIASFQADLPFDLVADPHRTVYKQFGVGKSLLYWLDFKTIVAALKGMVRLRINLKFSDGIFGLPSEYLIEPSGRILAVKHGRHAYDQWSVDELLSIAMESH